MITTIYLDMDGVIVDFRKQCEKYKCIEGTKIDWHIIHEAGPEFWEECPWTESGESFYKWLDRFCKEENFDKEDWSKGIIFKLKDNARIYTIDSYEDLTVLVNKYPNEKSIIRTDALDFNKIAEDYDAIHLTEEGQWKTRNTYPNTLYGWDCETLLVLNFNAIDLNSIEKYKE